MYCKNCGKEIDDNAAICIHCGVAQDFLKINDDENIGWGVLGFFVPIIGLVLYLVWKDEKPKNAKLLGLGAIISVGSIIFLYVSIIIFAIGSAIIIG